ncbi:anaphase-promoting complex subunit 4 isoform X2 [Macrosteles quadrilineatus]|nr:anaphase-promoting complex subunit 4 isoform X2 [Macrosteles quadrilineatus]
MKTPEKEMPEPKDKMSGHIIRQLEERHVASKVDLMVWSNKMDLLALSNTKGEIALHRLTWQRVWLLPPPSPDIIVRKLAWRPDGRVIAVAYVPKSPGGEEVKGSVSLVDVENKDILHTLNVSDDITSLVWLQESTDCPQTVGGHNQDGTADFLPKLPSLSRSYGSMGENAEENLEDAKRIKDQTHLNFLLIGTSDGNIYLSVFGLFSCGVINIKKHLIEDENDNKHISVLDAEMSSDMKSIYLLVAIDNKKLYFESTKEESESVVKGNTIDPEVDKELPSTAEKACQTSNKSKTTLPSDNVEGKKEYAKNAPHEGGSDATKRELKLVILDTRILSSRSRELHALSLKHGHIVSLLDYLSQTMRSIIEAWENIYLLEIESKLSKHAESLPEGSLSADFLELLLLGVASDTLENFLLRELNDKGIKKLGHSIELSHSNIQKLILKHLLSVGQSLAYHLAEMKGMAKLADRFKVLGLEEETVSEAFSACGSFLIKATEVQLVIDESMKRYKAFFRWLYAIILRISDDRIPDLTMTDISQQDLEFIADYLNNLDVKTDEDGTRKRHCYLDRLGQYLVNRDLTTPSENDKNNQWQKLLEENPCLQNHFCIIKRNKNNSLIQQHEHLKAAIETVFKTPEDAIGSMFQLKKVITVADVAYKRLTMSLLDDHLILISLIELDSPNIFKLIQIPADENRQVITKSVSFKSGDSVAMKCLDVQFYLPEILSVLLEEQDESKSAVIVQVMTKAICDNPLDNIEGNALSTDSVVMRQIPDLVASCFAVSGTRKIAVVLSESRRKVRLFEMEAEDEDEEDEMTSVEPSPGLNDSQRSQKSSSFLDDDDDRLEINNIKQDTSTGNLELDTTAEPDV